MDWPDQILLIIVFMRTTIIHSCSLVLSQRRFQFPIFSGWLVLMGLLTFLWPQCYLVLLYPGPVIGSTVYNSPLDGWHPYNTGRLRLDLKSHLHLGPIEMDVASPGRACYYSHSKNWLGVSAYIETTCHSLGDGVNQEFWLKKLAQLPILSLKAAYLKGLLVNFILPLSKIFGQILDVWDSVFPNLLWPTNVIARWTQNCVKLSILSDVWRVLWAIAT